MAGGGHVAGGVHDKGACVAGGYAWQGGGVPGRRDGHCSGRYPSYCNAFLLDQHIYGPNVSMAQVFKTYPFH